MKKRLTSIVNYQSPFGLGMNRESFSAGLKSLAVGAPLFLFFALLCGISFGMLMGVAGFMISFVLRVGVIDGKPALEYIKMSMDLSRHPDKQNLFYSHGEDEDDRLILYKEADHAETKEEE